MGSIIETIKAKIDVVDEIGLVVALHKAGKSLKGCCPFHNERTPSFYVTPGSQTWYCFGCHEGGDVFTFVQKQQGIEFHDALVYLAEKAGVSLDEGEGLGGENREASAAKARLRKLNDDALLWFQQVLLRSKEASNARAYVQGRGISTDSVMSFGIGYAPNQWDYLSNYLLQQGYTEEELVNGGLARFRESKDGNPEAAGIYDYFRQRVIFPIRDMRGHVIGFGGRALGDTQPKYLNSPQTLLFEKNTVLYAIDMAKDAIKQQNQIVIVEGYVDAIIAHQYGTKQTVACIGSSITEKHIQQIKKLTKQVTLALDPDAAGIAATEHGIAEALKGFDHTFVPVPLASGQQREQSKSKNKRNEARGMIRLEEQVDATINVLQLPPGEDPDEVIQRDYAAWFYAVTHPLPLVDYYFNAKTLDLDLKQPNDKAEAARRLLPVLGMISDRVKRDAYIRKLAGMVSIDERSLHQELQRVLRGQSQRVHNVHNATTESSGAPAQGARYPYKKPAIGGATPLVEVNGEIVVRSQVDREKEAQETRQAEKGSLLDKAKRDKLQWEDYLIGLLLLNPGLSPYVCGIIDTSDFAGTDTRELYHILNSVYQRGSSSSQKPFEQLVPSALLTGVERARKCVESKSPQDGAGLIKAAVQCAIRLKRTRLMQRNTELQYLMREATEDGNVALVRQFRQESMVIHRQLRTIDSATHLQG